MTELLKFFKMGATQASRSPVFLVSEEHMGAPMSGTTLSFAVTERAATKVKEMIAQENRDDLKLRVYITGGGCSGFQYGFSFDEATTEGDTEIEIDGVKVLVDPMSYQYLAGAELDYQDDLMGSQFVIRNPNAATTCGCGSSFSI